MLVRVPFLFFYYLIDNSANYFPILSFYTIVSAETLLIRQFMNFLKYKYLAIAATFLLVSFLSIGASALSDDEISRLQVKLKDSPVGERISYWAKRFIGTPYDRDPMGEYVTSRVIVADQRVDCMYHVFRSVELAFSQSPEGAIAVAIDKRFHSQGKLEGGLVMNYDDRFSYGEDMIDSGKWGREITADICKTSSVADERRRRTVRYIIKKDLPRISRYLREGDLAFLVKSPEKRVAGEVIGHMGIISVEKSGAVSKIYLVHAAGTKKSGGMVRKVQWDSYCSKMPFIGAKFTRFE